MEPYIEMKSNKDLESTDFGQEIQEYQDIRISGCTNEK
jgi:hypothetical protein